MRKYYAQGRHNTCDITKFKNILAEDVSNELADRESIDLLLTDIIPKHQQILKMMHIKGYSVREVASELSMNESAVKVAAHRAIKKIRTKLKFII